MRVYFDGLCHLCSREINHYRRLKGSDALTFVDITSPEFKAESEGLDPFEVHKELHAKDEQGNVHKGVAAFIQIWKRLPSYNWAARAAELHGVNTLLRAAYWVFARSIRPILPKKACSDSPYCQIASS